MRRQLTLTAEVLGRRDDAAAEMLRQIRLTTTRAASGLPRSVNQRASPSRLRGWPAETAGGCAACRATRRRPAHRTRRARERAPDVVRPSPPSPSVRERRQSSAILLLAQTLEVPASAATDG